MRDLDIYFENRAIDYNKLEQYGFTKKDNQYNLKTKICNEQFEMIINISTDTKTSKLIDLANEEEYVLVDILGATGEFIGQVKEEYESKLQDIVNKCTIANVFKSEQSKEIIKYVKEKYDDDLEFLWEKFADNAIWRNKQNNKWYGLLLKVQKNKLGIESEELIDIIDLRYQKDKNEEIIDNEKIFPGYHMNKKSWITIKLDNSMENNKIFELIDNSYNLVKGNKVDLKIYQWKERK